MAVLVGPVLGEPIPHFPLFLAEAVLVELIALRVTRPLPLAVSAGVAIGTVGLAAEWGWTQVFMPLPWPRALLPEGVLLGLAMALAGALVGAWLGARLAADRTPSLRGAAVLGAVAIFALTGYGLLSSGSQGLRGTVLIGDDGRAEVRVAARDVNWLTATAWQGGGLAVDRLREVSPGVYRTTEPLRLGGDWKTMIRLHSGDALTALPVYLPADPAIPVEGIPAAPRIERAFGDEVALLQRERKADVAGWLWAAAYGAVLAIALGFLALLAWGVHRASGAQVRPAAHRARARPAAARPQPR
jgi:hypothetical protein